MSTELHLLFNEMKEAAPLNVNLLDVLDASNNYDYNTKGDRKRLNVLVQVLYRGYSINASELPECECSSEENGCVLMVARAG